MKTRQWLKSTGVEVKTEELKVISRGWDHPHWESYLAWFEKGRREALVHPTAYDEICDRMHETIFDSFAQDSSDQKKRLCELMLAQLDPFEAKILRLIYMEGRTEHQVATQVKRSRSLIYKIKHRALIRLRRGLDGEKRATYRLMRGQISEVENSEFRFWKDSLNKIIKEGRVYDPKKCHEEFANIEHSALRIALAEISERQRQIIYRRFWLDESVSEIARDMKVGGNFVQDILDATISKLKRKIVEIEFGRPPEGEPTCA